MKSYIKDGEIWKKGEPEEGMPAKFEHDSGFTIEFDAYSNAKNSKTINYDSFMLRLTLSECTSIEETSKSNASLKVGMERLKMLGEIKIESDEFNEIVNAVELSGVLSPERIAEVLNV